MIDIPVLKTFPNEKNKIFFNMFKETFLDVMLERVFYFQQSSNWTKDTFIIDMKKQKDLAFITYIFQTILSTYF